MSSALWNAVGDIGRELGYSDARGRHSAVIREMLAATAAEWMHSPYICRSAQHTVYIAKTGDIFYRHVQVLKLNSIRERLPAFIEMKPEKREYYHRKHREIHPRVDEHTWFLNCWLLNYFAAWNGRKDADDLESFQNPLSSHIDTFGTNYKSADLPVRTVAGRVLTREVVIGLRDYVQWKEPNSSLFDYIAIPIDIPTHELDLYVILDQDLFKMSSVVPDELANMSLEFRNRESARFESKEVALYPETTIYEQHGRAPDDAGADEMLHKVRRLRQRIRSILSERTTTGDLVSTCADMSGIEDSLVLPQNFLFYWLKWPIPHLGIEACVRWEKPYRPSWTDEGGLAFREKEQ
ncbi:MAG TPA: hypothetical protein VH394_01610 [Thermoanaerobaculia bacterium]|jgi:hypothetical protein|nr:hypothetical protein [Thermoanaerobaculia bacterium]